MVPAQDQGAETIPSSAVIIDINENQLFFDGEQQKIK